MRKTRWVVQLPAAAAPLTWKLVVQASRVLVMLGVF
jgi:hypothetical protein